MLKFPFYVLTAFLMPFLLHGQSKDTLPIFEFGSAKANQNKEVTLNGIVRDSETRETIPAAVIQLLESGKNTVTEESGGFSIKTPTGKYTLVINFLGYEEFRALLHLHESANQVFEIKRQSINLQEVTINQNRSNDNVNKAFNGVEQMSIKKIEEKSRFLGETDVLRSLQSLAGVSSVGEGASGFNVQGGNTDENLILQDGNLIVNPVHALGFFSLFHPDLVKDITLYKGDVPAKYGGRLSSVLDIKLREGNNQKYLVKGGLGIASSRLAVEGPLVKNAASFIIGARASYFDWILKRVNNLDLRKSQAFFYDITAKMDARLSKSTKLGISVFSSEDDFQFAEEVKFDYSTQTASFYLKQLINQKINISFQTNIGQYNSSLYDIEGNNQSQFDNKIDYTRSSINSYFQLSKGYVLEAGLEQNHYKVSPGSLTPLGDVSIIKSESLAQENGIENALFVHHQIKFGEQVEIIAGLRYTLYQNRGADKVFLYQNGKPKSESSIEGTLEYGKNKKIINYAGLEPRFSFRINVNEKSSIKLGANQSYQYFSQISNTASATPIDIWQISNYYIPPQRAINFSTGYYRNDFENTLNTRLSFFYRKINRLIEYKDFAELLLNEHIETELLTGKGKAYGLEFSVNKDYGKHQFEGNYTFSRSLRKVVKSETQVGINNGNWYPSNYDKPHILNFNYTFKANEKRTLSMNFTYSTGRPTTAPVSSYINSNILNIPIYSNRNEYRIPDFHRMDLAYTIGPWGKTKDRENSLTFSIYNLYGRKNAFSVFFRQKAFQKITAYRVAVLGTMFPAITYNFKF